MKQLSIQISLLMIISMVVGCSQQSKDKDIKADLATKAQDEVAFAGVNYTVKNGTVYLSGNCPSLNAKEKVQSTVKDLAGVKNVEDSLQIAAVILDENFWVRRSVDSLLKDYPRATAQMSGDTVMLIGSVQKNELPKIMDKLKAIPARSVNNLLLAE
jgi:hypothetical protein